MSRTSTGLPAATSSSSSHSPHGATKAEYNAAHEALKADDTTWQSLAFAGIQHDGQGGLVEYRYCAACQSTLARPIAPAQALYLCQMQAALQERSLEAVRTALESGRAQTPRRRRRTAARVLAAGALLLALWSAWADAREEHSHPARPDMLAPACPERDPASDERMRLVPEPIHGSPALPVRRQP